MKLTSYGAALEVTGSQHLLEVNGKRILLDCGLFQGHRQKAFEKNQEFLYDPATIDAVVISHAHIDHTGRIPFLVKEGFIVIIRLLDKVIVPGVISLIRARKTIY